MEYFNQHYTSKIWLYHIVEILMPKGYYENIKSSFYKNHIKGIITITLLNNCIPSFSKN